MSEEEREGPPQRYCGGGDAEIRPGDAFCASCGKPLGLGDSDQAGHSPAPEESEIGGPKSGSAAQDEAVSSTADRAVRTSPGGGSNRSGAFQGRARWFEELSIVSRALLVGLAILVALPLLALLSPIALVAAAMSFGVGLIGLIVRLGQRRSVKGWGLVAVGSLALMVLSGYFLVLIYGSLLDGSSSETGSGSAKDAAKQASADEKNTQALREAAFRQPPLGVRDQKYIDDLRVTGGTATVEFVGMVEPGREFMAVAERVQGKQTCSSMASVAGKNNIPVDKVEVISSRGEELASCGVKRFTTTGKDKQKQRTTADSR